jgi:hypothetical protein
MASKCIAQSPWVAGAYLLVALLLRPTFPHMKDMKARSRWQPPERELAGAVRGVPFNGCMQFPDCCYLSDRRASQEARLMGLNPRKPNKMVGLAILIPALYL